jgi:hypothetical protein
MMSVLLLGKAGSISNFVKLPEEDRPDFESFRNRVLHLIMEMEMLTARQFSLDNL